MRSLARLISALLVGSVGISIVHAGGAVELEEFNFDRWVTGKPALIEFWAPWCEHCKDLVPVYDELADAFDHVKDKLVIAKINADVLGSKSLIEKYWVTGLPTIKYISEDGEIEDYDPEAPRKLDDLVNFVTKKSGFKSNLRPPSPPLPPPPSITKQLTAENFDKIVNDPEKDILVVFTATWCEHCRTLKPIYDLVAWKFRSEEHVVIASLNADEADSNRELATKYDIKGYPFIKLFPKGSGKEPIDFKLPRDERYLVDFLNKFTGTQRNLIGAGLTDQAGRSAHLDDLASEFMAALPSERKKLYKKAKTAAISAGKSGKQYLRIMDKLINGTDDYLAQEKTRLAGILKKRTLSDEKLDDIQIRSNVLSAFVTTAAKKVAEGVRIERSVEETATEAETASETTSNSDEATETETKRVKEEL